METTSETALEVTPENYRNILLMINSPDSGDNSVGLRIIETCDHEKSSLLVLLLKKNCRLAPDVWKQQAPKAVAFIESFGLDISKPIAHAELFELWHTRKLFGPHFQFLLDEFAHFVWINAQEGYGFDFMKECKLTLTLRPDHELYEAQRNACESVKGTDAN